jgi:ribosomal protein S18 acetylase RimI-like enzyme
MALWRREVAQGRQDIVPNEERFRRLLGRFDWDTRSRVVEDGDRLAGCVLVLSRPSPEGVLANVYAAGEGDAYGEMVRWGVHFSRAAGAAVVQVFIGKDHGDRLEDAGLRKVRPWWRMDRSLEGALPGAAAIPGYELLDATRVTPGAWADLFNRTFADHWRFAPRGEEEILGDKAPGLCLMATTSGPSSGVAIGLGEIEDYADDPRPQPVGIISSVGTLPAHRGRGLAGWLVADLLGRLRHAGARHASLYVDGLNPMHAVDLYRKLGFEVAFEAEVWEATSA